MIFPGTDLERITRERGALPRDLSRSAYDADLNRRLGQLPNVPLYHDGLDADAILVIQEACRRGTTLIGATDEASRLTPRELFLKAVRAAVHAKPSARHRVSPRFNAALARNIWSRVKP